MTGVQTCALPICRLVIPISSTTAAICTAWRVTNGAFLTAGHCIDDDPDEDGPMGPDGVPDMVAHAIATYALPAREG